MQTYGMARYHVNPLCIGNITWSADLKIVRIRAQPYRLHLPRRPGVGTVDEHLGVLDVRVQFDLPVFDV